MSKYRRKMKSGKSKKLFSRTADNTQKKNLRASPMRGGIRL